MRSDNENRRFCSACGAPLTGTPFCGQCGAKVVVTAVHTYAPAPVENVAVAVETAPAVEPVYVEEVAAAVQNIPVAEVAPAVETVSEPERVVIPEPVVQIETRPRKFPVASVILMGIVAAWMVIQLVISQYATWSGIVHVCCVTAVLVGMIVCRKKRNLIVGFAFLAYACAYLISTIINYADQLRGGIDFSILIMLLMAMIYPLAYIAFSISYLVAKPKIAVLKNIMGGFLAGFGLLGTVAMGIAIIAVPNISNSISAFLTYLLYMLPMGLSVILYTPFKKR